MSSNRNGYWNSLGSAFASTLKGLKLTFGHILNARKKRNSSSILDSDYFQHQHGIATIQYPHENIPVPDNGRYQLHNEIDDCIVCDKCAKICPVDCITIEPIRSPTEFGKTSDGTPKRIYAAKFDIDMAKCCFCGLCTTVCPTECLTMTKEYDFSVFDIQKHNFEFADMTPSEIEQRKKEMDEHQSAKATTEIKVEPKPAGAARPAFKPKINPPGNSDSTPS